MSYVGSHRKRSWLNVTVAQWYSTLVLALLTLYRSRGK